MGRTRQVVFFLCFVRSLHFLCLADWGKGDREAPLGRHGSLWVAAGGAGWGWDFIGKKCMYTPASCLRAAAPPLP